MNVCVTSSMHCRYVFILFKGVMLCPNINERWVKHIPCPYLNADVVDVSLPTPFCIQRLHLFVTIGPWLSK